jgi:hypothetical protein
MTFASRSTCFIFFMVKLWVPERTHHSTVWTGVWPRTDILKTQQFRCPKAIETAGRLWFH